MSEPKHPTCIDVSALPAQPGTEWVCGPNCPRDVPACEHTNIGQAGQCQDCKVWLTLPDVRERFDVPDGYSCPDHPGPLDDPRDHVCRLRPVLDVPPTGRTLHNVLKQRREIT